MDKIKKEIDKIDLTQLDDGAIRQSLSVLSASDPDYLVIDLVNKLREELKRREIKND